MAPQILIVVLAFLSTSYALENLKLAYQWKLVDFEYPSVEDRQKAISNGEFVPENNLPLGLEVYEDRLFITVPRWKAGVPASLTYINLKDPSQSPKLRPYPNWAAHKLPENENGDPPEIVSPFRVRADRCGRLWVLDTGVADLFGTPHVYSPSRVVIYDLRTDALLRSFSIPSDQVSKASFLANIAVEDEDCEDAYGYFGDLGDPAVVVYSFKQNNSWRIKHAFFSFNPFFAEFNVAGSTFIWTDGVFGMGLSAPGSDGFSTLFFHPMTGTHEFSVSTRYLRNATLAQTNFNLFKLLGSRGPNGQSSVSFLDKKSGVLFYALVNQNAIACWRTTNPTYTMENQGRIHESDVDMIFPNDIKVDVNDNVWVLSDRLPIFLYQTINQSDINYRIFTAPVSEAIKNTICDSTPPNLSNTAGASAQAPGIQATPDDPFGIFTMPNTLANPSMSKPSGQKPTPAIPPNFSDKIKPAMQAFAIAEIPETINKFDTPAQPPQLQGNSDLMFFFKPPASSDSEDHFSPTRVPVQFAQALDAENKPKKGFELLINVPVNLYVSVETP